MVYKHNSTILVTGACGFVGSNLVNHLLETGVYNNVVACCHYKDKANNLFLESERVVVVEADLLTPESYRSIFESYHIDDIIHLAAIARFKQGEEYPDKTIQANLFGSIELLKMTKQFGCHRFLYASSNLARNPKGVTGVSKYLFEAYLKNNTAPPVVSSIRLPNVIDSPGAVTLIFKKQIDNGNAITITDKRMTRKFVTPMQAAGDLLFALNSGSNQNIFVNNKLSTSIFKMACEMIDKSGKDIPIRIIGMKSGEKLQEEDYPDTTILSTKRGDIFLLTEDQHYKKNISYAIDLLRSKVNGKTLRKIRTTFRLA